MKTGSRVLFAGLLALSGAAAAPAIAVAECSPLSVADDIRDYIGVAFTATVAEVTDEVDAPMADAAPFDWKVVLDVDRVYRGDVEETLHWNGWGAGCSGIRPDMFEPGQRYFFATARLDPAGMRAPGPYTLVWKQDGDRWPFHNRVLKTAYGSKPPEARTASSLRSIRRAVGALHGGWYPPAPRQARATDALGDRPNAIEVDEPPGSAWVDETGAEVDGPPYGLSVTQMRVLVEDDRLVALFRPGDGPTDVPPAPDLRYSLFVDTDGDLEADVELRTFADGEVWAAAMHRLDPQADGTVAAEDLDPLVNEYGVGTSVDLATLGPAEDLRFAGQAATGGVVDNVPDGPDGWVSLLAEW